MAKKKKAMNPIPKSETYLKYGLVETTIEQYYCPRCRHLLSAGPMYQPRYCDQCGQRIKFDGIEWKKEVTRGYVEGRDAI